jgi:hypothetical protein
MRRAAAAKAGTCRVGRPARREAVAVKREPPALVVEAVSLRAAVLSWEAGERVAGRDKPAVPREAGAALAVPVPAMRHL